MKFNNFFTIIIFSSVLLGSCKKDWLQEKRDISLVVPTTLKDLRLLLNNHSDLIQETREITEVASDDVYVTQDQFNAFFSNTERNAYIWNSDVFGSQTTVSEWNIAYRHVLYANVVLEGLKKIDITDGNRLEYNSLKGTALFYRGRAFLNLALTFCKYYNFQTANTDLGIPLKISSDINEKVKRSSLKETYDQILTDLTTATQLLPNTVSGPRYVDPSKVAAYATLARCYLYMDNYQSALDAANSSYSLHNILLDFNTLNPVTSRPIPGANGEIHLYSGMGIVFISNVTGYIDPQLYSMYNSNDLRKTMYFSSPMPSTGLVTYRGSYIGSSVLFGGTTTGEMLLIRAECKARLNDPSGAIADLNTLLLKRFKTGTFIPIPQGNVEEILTTILDERRKELVRRGLRLPDLKRLNRDSRFQKVLTKTLSNQVYTLPPNDPKYVFPIPEYIIQYNNIQQNPR